MTNQRQAKIWQSMAFQGNLQDIPLPDILQLLAGQARSGVLTLSRGKEEVRIHISQDGMAVYADASTRSLDERLGARLVNTGRLSQGDLESTRAGKGENGVSLGHLLVSAGRVPAEEVGRAASLEFRQILYDVLRWKSGSYAFERRELDCDRDLTRPIGFQALLMDGMRMIDEWPLVERRTGHRQLILHKAPLAEGQEPDPPLSDAEAEVYRKVDGRATIQRIVDSTMQLEFDVCRALYDLCERELVFPGYEGRLEDVSVGELLYAVLRSRQSGVLDLRREGLTKSVVFREGRIVTARSSDPDDGIGPYLLARSLLTRRELRAALDSASSPEDVGAWLVSSGKLGRQELEGHTAEQMSAVVRSLLEWTQGTYHFRPGRPPDVTVGLEPRTERIIVEGIRSVDRWSLLERAVGADSTLYRRADAPPGELLRLLPEELRRRLDHFADGLTVDQACAQLEMPELMVYQMLWGWWVIGLLDRAGLPRKTTSLLAALSGAPSDVPLEEVGLDAGDGAPEAESAAAQAASTCDLELGTALAELAARCAEQRPQEPAQPEVLELDELTPDLLGELAPDVPLEPPRNTAPPKPASSGAPPVQAPPPVVKRS